MPFGLFFKDFSAALVAAGCHVKRVVFDAGDFVSTPAQHRLVYRGNEAGWPRFIETILRRYKIDGVITFNDAHFREAGALAAAERLGIHRYVMEHGYLRPRWITFERDGVNADSKLPRAIEFYRDQNIAPPSDAQFDFRLRGVVVNTIAHFAVAIAGSPFLRYNSRYYGDSIRQQASGYVFETLRRLSHTRHREMLDIEALRAPDAKPFLCLLQKPGDVQLVRHSRFDGNAAFIREVMQSFAASAPENARLIIKQHPLDYGKEGCDRLVFKLAEELGIASKVAFVRNISIENIMPLIEGAITINSTAGLACIMAGKSVKSLGRAIYNFEGLTDQKPLDEFWHGTPPPLASDVACFVNYLKATSQFNGGFETAAARMVLVPLLVDAIKQDTLAWHPAAKAAPLQEPRGPIQSVHTSIRRRLETSGGG
ncbi:MAG: hypothetical protein POH28_09425 [Acidocella sp.]|nr:hypothetical protein [Acidocella sp.]